MKTIKQSFKIIPQDKGLEGIYKQIELGGKVCYQSTHTITEDSAEKFVKDVLIKNGHGRPLEHGTVYLMIHTVAPKEWDKNIARHSRIIIDDAREYIKTNPTYNSAGEEHWWAKEAKHIAYRMAVKYADNPYSKVNIVLTKHEVNTEGATIITPTNGLPRVTKAPDKMISKFNTILITTNLRVLVENNWLDDLKYLCEPTEYHEKRVTVNVVCDRQIQTEIKTHTTLSSTFESTRYCNYNKDKFGNELTFIESDNFPNLEIKHSPAYDNTWEVLMSAYEEAEAYYMTLIEAGVKPQFAAKVLPFGVKGEGYITGFISDWIHFFNMRTPINAHPDIQDIANGIKEEFIKLGYINN
jgi:thymidylate synthase (FAD)